MEWRSHGRHSPRLFTCLFTLARIACLLHFCVKTSSFDYSIWATPNNKVSNSLCERAQEKNSGDAVRQMGTIIQSIFVPSQEPAFAYDSVRVSTQGLFRLCLKTFVAPFLPARVNCPWVSEGLIYGHKENWETSSGQDGPGSQSERRIRFLLTARHFSHIIIAN